MKSTDLLYSKTQIDKSGERLKTFGVSQIEEATGAYLELEKRYFEDINMNVVLVNSGDVKKLELSYPNYFMDTKTLVKNLSLIVMEKYF